MPRLFLIIHGAALAVFSYPLNSFAQTDFCSDLESIVAAIPDGFAPITGPLLEKDGRRSEYRAKADLLQVDCRVVREGKSAEYSCFNSRAADSDYTTILAKISACDLIQLAMPIEVPETEDANMKQSFVSWAVVKDGKLVGSVGVLRWTVKRRELVILQLGVTQKK